MLPRSPGALTYREDLEDVDGGEVALLASLIWWQWHRDILQVLREQNYEKNSPGRRGKQTMRQSVCPDAHLSPCELEAWPRGAAPLPPLVWDCTLTNSSAGLHRHTAICSQRLSIAIQGTEWLDAECLRRNQLPFLVSKATEHRPMASVHILCICINKGAQQPDESLQNTHLSWVGVTAYYSGCLTHSINRCYFHLLLKFCLTFFHLEWKFPWKTSAPGQIFWRNIS